MFCIVTPTGFVRATTFDWVEALRMQTAFTKADKFLHTVKRVPISVEGI